MTQADADCLIAGYLTFLAICAAHVLALGVIVAIVGTAALWGPPAGALLLAYTAAGKPKVHDRPAKGEEWWH